MAKGTPSQGRRSGKKNHIRCRRCGQRTYHISRKVCSSCGYGNSAKMRSYSWQKKKGQTKVKRVKKLMKKKRTLHRVKKK